MTYYYNSYSERVEWLKYIDTYGANLLYALGLDENKIREEIRYNHENPVVRRLKDDPNDFVAKAKQAGDGKENIVGICRVAVLCQMMLYDDQNGPEQDGKPKALRRHWYAYFKQFSQMLAFALGKTQKNSQGVLEMVDVQWSGRLSKVYAEFVDSGHITYKQLWIQDASRMFETTQDYERLFRGFNVIVAVEKDSLFADFTAASKGLGAMAVISGKGKNSKAAAELMLRKLGWTADHNPFAGEPIIVVHLSDHDYDGEGVIGPTFGEQIRRYHDWVIEARIGVKPTQVEAVVPDTWEASYQVKMSNTGYREWAEENALFWATCYQCGHEQYIIGLHENECKQCGSWNTTEVTDTSYDQPHGFEVEALGTREYHRAMVDAVLEQVDWWKIVEGLRSQARPEEWQVTERILRREMEQHPAAKKLSSAIEVLRQAEEQLQQDFSQILSRYVESAISDTEGQWKYDGEDPDVDSYIDHVLSVGRGSTYASPFRPFDMEERIHIVLNHLEYLEDLQGEMQEVDLEDYNAVVEEVANALNS